MFQFFLYPAKITNIFRLCYLCTVMQEKTYHDATVGDVIVRKSPRARNVGIRISSGKGIVVTIPSWMPYRLGLAYLAREREKVMRVWLRQQARLARTDEATGIAGMNAEEREAEAKRLRKEAKAYLPERLAGLARQYGFVFNKVFIKHNRSNWGSCSTKGNINLNLNLMRLPEHLRDYVMLHELAHLRHPNHGPAFHDLLDRLCRDCTGRSAREMEKEIKKYRLI